MKLVVVAKVRGDAGELETIVGRIEDAHAISIVGREDNLAIGSRNCSAELVVVAQLRGLSALNGAKMILPLAAGAAPSNL